MTISTQQQQGQVLAARRQRAERRLGELRQVEARFPWLRLGALVLGLVITYLGFQLLPRFAAWIAAALALGLFALAADRHRAVIERITRLETFHHLLGEQIARLNLDWEGIPPAESVAVPTEHPFASDLNITGSRSLHQLLDTAAARDGSLRLAGWLLAEVPDVEQIAARQGLVRDLLARPAFRLRLELDGRFVGMSTGAQPVTGANLAAPRKWDGSTLLRWLESAQPTGSLRPALVALIILAAANISLFALNTLGLIPPLWIGTFILYFGIQASKFRQSSEVFNEAYTLARQLGQLRGILADLEDYPYNQDTPLGRLCAPFWKGPARPSAALRQIGWIVTAASLRNNPFLALLLNILVPWDMFFADQLERFKQRLRGHLPGWLDAWAELEALSALANFAALNRAYTFPHILPLTAQPVFAARGIGHPLIPQPARVVNDFTLERMGEVVIITGSNMSGKSTFLRTLGVNLALAYAGSVAAVAELQALPFRLFTSMTLADSLSDGISFFYAEVRRLKALLNRLEEMEAPLPLFFLIDEIFRGTNNRERQIGSYSYTQALTGKRGVGLISTHDLELAHLAERFPGVHNFHFREDVHDGRMVFDYKIRPGASPTTNALRIMRLAGLPVEEKDARA